MFTRDVVVSNRCCFDIIGDWVGVAQRDVNIQMGFRAAKRARMFDRRMLLARNNIGRWRRAGPIEKREFQSGS